MCYLFEVRKRFPRLQRFEVTKREKLDGACSR